MTAAGGRRLRTVETDSAARVVAEAGLLSATFYLGAERAAALGVCWCHWSSVETLLGPLSGHGGE